MNMKPIVVTGGTGTLGRPVAARLRERGQQVRVLSRHPGQDRVVGDLVSGAGVAQALAGSGTVVHCATTLRGGRDVTATRTLVQAAREADVSHLVYISIVGVDANPFGYYRGKLAAEQAIAESGLPFTILRATQFHDLLARVFAATVKLPVMFVPTLRVQPVEVTEVAARLADLAEAEPAGRVSDLGGPQVRSSTDLARAYLTATGKRRSVVGFSLPAKAFRAAAGGSLLAPDHADGTITFEQYLAAR